MFQFPKSECFEHCYKNDPSALPPAHHSKGKDHVLRYVRISTSRCLYLKIISVDGNDMHMPKFDIPYQSKMDSMIGFDWPWLRKLWVSGQPGPIFPKWHLLSPDISFRAYSYSNHVCLQTLQQFTDHLPTLFHRGYLCFCMMSIKQYADYRSYSSLVP